MTVTYSRTIERPEEQSCERFVINPNVIKIKELNDRKFDTACVYLKFQTTFGCRAMVKASFPTEDRKQERMKKLIAGLEDKRIATNTKAKLEQSI